MDDIVRPSFPAVRPSFRPSYSIDCSSISFSFSPGYPLIHKYFFPSIHPSDFLLCIHTLAHLSIHLVFRLLLHTPSLYLAFIHPSSFTSIFSNIHRIHPSMSIYATLSILSVIYTGVISSLLELILQKASF